MNRALLSGTVGLLCVVLIVAALPVRAHGNHISVDNQVSADGTILVEQTFVAADAHLVLHADDDGEPGSILGHRPVAQGFHAPITVKMDTEHWNRQAENVTVWAIMYHDRGAPSFDPETDTQLETFGRLVGSPIRVRKGTGAVSVAASGFSVQRTNGTVTIPQVQSADNGHLVLRTNEDGSLGQVAGNTTIDAGTNKRVNVSLDGSFFGTREGQFELWAVVYEDDGNGVFDPVTENPVRVGDSTVASLFTLESTRNVTTTESDSLVNTPTQTPEMTPTQPSKLTPTSPPPSAEGTTDRQPTTTTEGPGFGIWLSLLALFVLVGERLTNGE